MQQGYTCPNCGRPLTYVNEYQNWYCHGCGMYPFQQHMPTPYYPPQKDDSTKVIGMVILVIVIVIVIVIVAAAVLYVMVSGMMSSSETTPTGALDFSESTTEVGTYTGGIVALSRQVDIFDVSMTITDDSLGMSSSLDPLRDEGPASIFNGMRCTFSDVNNNDRLDAGDSFRVENGGPGDVIRLVYIPTGGVMALYTLR
ncbi:MAG: hypothetical protein JSW28_04050 [Thermoplasmata archaeon]|nr:MAG: hypothetical protein JSW28_04050 [Thermoplasmata archaeon]